MEVRNRYSGLVNANFVICLKKPYLGQNTRKYFIVGNRYKINYRGNNSWEIGIENEFGGQEIFNIHSSFGDNFCTLKYLRKKNLKN